jgi:ketosteroid isomerase-like protein
LSTFDDFVEWHDIPEMPWTALYRGRAEVIAYLREFEPSGVMALRFDIVELHSVGDEVFVVAKVEAEGSMSGVALSESEFCYLWRVREGKIVRVRVFLDREHALADADPA